MFIRSVLRFFGSEGRAHGDVGHVTKMRDINVFTGSPKPAAREGTWVCPYPLSEHLDKVIRLELKKRDWHDVEIEREISEIRGLKATKSAASCENSWTTVEDFQRTPWFKRYRPNDTSGSHFVSHDLIKLLEETIVPPSLRSDPYNKLRKRHYEDYWVNERFSEDGAKTKTRQTLAAQTKGSPTYGIVTRKSFIQFEREWKARNPGVEMGKNDVYDLWKQEMTKVVELEAKKKL
eukprot:PhM_4_TR4596/c0_g1_i1/m.54741